ncbi:hypothetical protein MCEMSEM23_01955 [Rhabdaerophilaceae bacterium]
MEARVIQPVAATAQTPARPVTVPVRQAVPTELAAPEAVSAQAGADKARSHQRDNRKEPGLPKQTVSSCDIDRETGALVYQLLDKDTSAVIDQYPYDSLLRLRAYLKLKAEGES